MAVPYEGATGKGARDEISKILRRFGAQSIGWMDDIENHEVILAFKHRGRAVQLRASARGWATMWLKEHRYNASRHRTLTKETHTQRALEQGMRAVNSILRDWVKGQVTAVECGILSFEHVFMPYTLLPDGRTVAAYVQECGLLPGPEQSTEVAVRGLKG